MQCQGNGRTAADEALAAHKVPHSQAAQSVRSEAVMKVCEPHMPQPGCREMRPHARACRWQ